MNYQQHPLSAAFPPMSAEELESLRDSIINIGVQQPVTLFEGMVIDGWHRYTVATEVGMPCPTVDMPDVDPKDFVLGQNKSRRHVTVSQMAMAVTAVHAWRPAGNPSFVQSGTECRVEKTTAALAEIGGVGERSIRQAKAVQNTAVPEVQAAVKRGEIGLPKAAAIAKLPSEQQAAAIAQPLPKAKSTPAAPPAASQTTNQADPHEAERPTELDDAHEALKIITAENEILRDRLAVGLLQGTDEEKSEAATTITEMRAKVRALEAEVSALRSSRDAYQREASELRKQLQYNARQAKRAEVA